MILSPMLLLEFGLSLLPVFCFLGVLLYLDSYKLVHLSAILLAVLIGVAAALASLAINTAMLSFLSVDATLYSRYGGPVVEEICKGAYLFYLMRSNRVGFMVDAAISGFAIGAGFAIVENVYYLHSLGEVTLLLWIVRGFGTATMHGGTTAIFAVLAKSIADLKGSVRVPFFIPGFLTATAIHSLFNHFLLPPLTSAIVILAVLPAVLIGVFYQSENITRHWLGVGFDTDRELLEMLASGDLPATKVGQYLQTLETRFPPVVVADMLCLLRLHLELSIGAKGILMMRQAGFDTEPDPAVREKFEEIHYLEKAIGRTGMLAILPFLHTSERHLWQLHMLRSAGLR